MKRTILTFAIVAFLTLVSCNERPSGKNKTADQDTLNTQRTENNIVTDSVTNDEGKTLYMTFKQNSHIYY